MKNWTAYVLLGSTLIWALAGLGAGLPQFIHGIPLAAEYIGCMFPPDLTILPDLWVPILEQIRMSIAAVFFATLIAVPLSFLGARATAPSPVVYAIVHGIITFTRGLPTLIWALLGVAMFGLGSLPGLMALILHCVGGLGKYFIETTEALVPQIREIMEAMRVDGASDWQVLYYGLLREAAPYFIGYIITYLEWSLRIGATLGLVGAGGLGVQFYIAVKLFRRQQTLTIILVIISIVSIVDALSWYIRRRFMR